MALVGLLLVWGLVVRTLGLYVGTAVVLGSAVAVFWGERLWAARRARGEGAVHRPSPPKP
jgi:hypothetical protein